MPIICQSLQTLYLPLAHPTPGIDAYDMSGPCAFWNQSKITDCLLTAVSFGNPQTISLPTTRFGSTIILDMCLRYTLCDAVIMITV